MTPKAAMIIGMTQDLSFTKQTGDINSPKLINIWQCSLNFIPPPSLLKNYKEQFRSPRKSKEEDNEELICLFDYLNVKYYLIVINKILLF